MSPDTIIVVFTVATTVITVGKVIILESLNSWIEIKARYAASLKHKSVTGGK